MTEDSFVDYYRLLGVTSDADANAIRAAFISLAKQHHPDKGGDAELMRRLTSAYRTLMRPASRRAYDMLHGFDAGGHSDAAVVDDDDAAIDEFLDTLYAEYARPKNVKNPLLTRIKKWL